MHFLNHVFAKSDITPEELEVIIPKFKKVEFKKGDFMLQAGKTVDHYWFIQDGFIRSFAVDPDGNDVSTGFYTVGDIAIEWSSFFLRQPTKENFQTLTDCVCWQIDFNSFQELFHSIKNFREQGRTTLVGSYFGLKRHNISMITDKAIDRYKALLKEKPHIIKNVSLKHIASYLGVTDTSLSRIRKEVAEG